MPCCLLMPTILDSDTYPKARGVFPSWSNATSSFTIYYTEPDTLSERGG